MATAPAAATFGFGTPFAEQLDFFRRKLNLPTERWDDIMRAAHDRAFAVAGAAKADLLQDLRTAVDKAMESGSLAGFRKDFRALVEHRGWTGWTGEGSKAGEAWRTRIIYQTNMATSYAAGRRRQMVDPEFAAIRPYWKYVHSDGVLHPRPEHQRWDGLTLPREHAFWKTHFAPNGWNCFPAHVPVRCKARLGLKTWYAGEMVELTTAGGNNLTVTANHPVLTARGWVCAHEVQEGDELIGSTGYLHAALVGVIDDEQAPARAEELFESLAAQGLRVAPMAPHDFHGDASLRKPEVHIAGSDGALVDVVEASRRQFIGESGLEVGLHGGVEAAGIPGGTSQALLIEHDVVPAQHVPHGWLGNAQPLGDLRLADEAAAVQRQRLALHRGVARIGSNPGCTELSFDAAGRGLDSLPSRAFGGGLVAQGDAGSGQCSPEQVSGAARLFGELLQANPTQVTRDEVVQIGKAVWAGHVFDFVTDTGLILAGGLVVSNCRCEIHPVKAPAPGAATEPPAGWDQIDDKTGAPVGIDRGFDYAPGASTDVALRQMVQDKLITYPDAITAALSRDVTRYVNASQPAPAFVRRVLADPTVAEPLWLGFADDFARIGQAAGAEVKGYLVLLPAETPRHVFRDHEHDGGTQRLAQPDDYSRLAETLNSADSLRAGTASRHGNATVVATKRFGAEVMRAVFERLPGKHNRSLALISLVVKVGR
ncbi:MAG: phage minor head protein [Burkholderiaceae bacterium]|nr:phage minor head protein [Burkholderiaceae bacterium]